MRDKSGQSRAVIEGITPEIDGGRFPIKRVVGETVVVEADIFGDGHDYVAAVLRYRQGTGDWAETPMEPIVNDRWRGSFTVTQLGIAEYTVVAWVDRFHSWARDLKRRPATDPDIGVNLQVGIELIEAASKRASGADANWLGKRAELLSGDSPMTERLQSALDPELATRMTPYLDRAFATEYEIPLRVVVDRLKARFSSWYELFPRSWGKNGEHGTFADVINQLPRIASMGFDVLYLPPIHPIGEAFRKGKNNNPKASEGDVGSPWGIGGKAGGHDAIHPELGTLNEFKQLVAEANKQKIDIALDIAYQCSPDHPWVKDHPEWFRARPDGSIQYAENPPKKYQDIYPIDFESKDWKNLWEALRDVVLYWIKQGVTIFRVDNPHTKAFPFWEWMIGTVKEKHPETIFLSEAFTRPKVMYRLAKVGFSQSYTYFTWRNTKHEITDYFEELTSYPAIEIFRPNLWPNTPDILPEFLQWCGTPGYMLRLTLATTLGASYGVYGAAFELQDSTPVAPGKEEYRDSEKYEIKQWDLKQRKNLSGLMAQLNRIRHENPALQSDRSLYFHPTTNNNLICYSKFDAATRNRIVVIVNLDPKSTQSGMVDLHLYELALEGTKPFQMLDQLTGECYQWNGGWNYVSLNPNVIPMHVFTVRQRVRTEQSFDTFM